MEEEKAKRLNDIFKSYKVHPSRIILSHTPMQELLALYRDAKVLILGKEGVLRVVRSLGIIRVREYT